MTGDGVHLGANAQAVYRCFSGDGHLLYVGVTGHLGRRLATHAQKIWFLEVRGITLEWYANKTEALDAERRAIAIERPEYNIMQKEALRRGIPPSRMRPPRPLVEVPELGDVEDRKDAFAQVLEEADESGVAPRKLKQESQLSRSLIHKLLAQLVEAGAVVKLDRGYYRAAIGQDVRAAIAKLDLEARARGEVPPWRRGPVESPHIEEEAG